jgi:hypothetical protein
VAVTVDAFAADLAEVAANLRAAAETGLRRELTKAIKDAAGTIPPRVRAELKPHLPDRYAETLDADLNMGVSVRTGARDPAVTVWARPRSRRRRALARLDRGLLGHPVFGMRSETNPRLWAAWEYQRGSVRPGFFTGPARDAAPRVRAEIEAALERVKDEIWKGH